MHRVPGAEHLVESRQPAPLVPVSDNQTLSEADSVDSLECCARQAVPAAQPGAPPHPRPPRPGAAGRARCSCGEGFTLSAAALPEVSPRRIVPASRGSSHQSIHMSTSVDVGRVPLFDVRGCDRRYSVRSSTCQPIFCRFLHSATSRRATQAGRARRLPRLTLPDILIDVMFPGLCVRR